MYFGHNHLPLPYVLKWRSFCNSASFAAVASLLTLFCFCTKLMFASSVISSHCTWSKFTLFFPLLISSCMLYQHLFLPVAFPALPSTVAFIHSSVFCNLYWISSFAFGVFLFCWIFCVSSLSELAAGNSSDTVWGSGPLSHPAFHHLCLLDCVHSSCQIACYIL